jgi:hypothetical protein
MAGEVAAPLGELFVSLIPTQSEVRTCGSREQYQQLIIFNIIKEFGFDIELIVQVPPRVRSKINRGVSIFPRITTGPEQHPERAAESRRVSDCIHLGYLSDFLIIRGVPQYSTRTIDREYRHLWQQASNVLAMIVATITHTGRECEGTGNP